MGVEVVRSGGGNGVELSSSGRKVVAAVRMEWEWRVGSGVKGAVAVMGELG